MRERRYEMPKLNVPLSGKARVLCEYKVAHPLKTQKELAADLGFNPKTVAKWCQDENFLDYEHELCLKIFKDAQGIALKTMIEAAKKGNTKAAQYLLDNTGFKLPDEQNINLSGDMEINIGE